MPSNVEVSKKFSVYRTLCCDAEIVIGVDAVFPDCPNHRNLTTRMERNGRRPEDISTQAKHRSRELNQWRVSRLAIRPDDQTPLDVYVVVFDWGEQHSFYGAQLRADR